MVVEYLGVAETSKMLAVELVACRKPQYLCETLQWLTEHIVFFKAICNGVELCMSQANLTTEDVVRNPVVVRTKGRGGASTSAGRKGKGTSRKNHACGVC